MAEYYPLLAKAVAGLPNATPDVRRAVYDRARKALLAQLRNLEPPVAEADIARESEALDGAVARLEAELAGRDGQQVQAPAVNPPTPQVQKPAGKAAPPPVAPASRMPLSPGRPVGPVPPPTVPSGSMPQPGYPAAGRNPGVSDRAKGATESEARNFALPGGPGQKAKPGPEMDTEARYVETSDSLDEADSGGAIDEAAGWDRQRPRAEGLRPYAPQPGAAEETRSTYRLWIVGGIVALVVVGVAIAAWVLRDRPDRLAKLKSPVPVQLEKKGKIIERIGAGSKEEEPSHSAEVAPANPTPANPTPVNPTPVNPASVSAPAPKASASDSGQTIPVAQRAALLVAAPDEPNKMKTYVGTVVWRLDNVSNGAGQPLGTAVRADIDIPGDKMKVAMVLQKNMDASLPASHTITVNFTVQSDSLTGGIKQISVPLLRQDDSPTGDALIGVPVPITDNSFLIGLSRGSAEATNLDLIKQRAWFDIPILLGNGRIAKLTFEKSTSGTRTIDEAITAWQAQ